MYLDHPVLSCLIRARLFPRNFKIPIKSPSSQSFINHHNKPLARRKKERIRQMSKSSCKPGASVRRGTDGRRGAHGVRRRRCRRRRRRHGRQRGVAARPATAVDGRRGDGGRRVVLQRRGVRCGGNMCTVIFGCIVSETEAKYSCTGLPG